MPVDGKYGHVTLEHGAHIPDNEPVIVFRAKNRLLPDLLSVYHELCETAGSPQRHLDLIRTTIMRIDAWQSDHETKTPDS